MKSIEDWKKEYPQDNFCGSTFQTPKGGILTVVGIAGKQGPNKLYASHCSICHMDEEMFPVLETSQRSNLERGFVPCASRYRWSDRQYRLRLTNLDYEIISQESINSARQKIKVRCKHDGYEWEPFLNNLTSGKGCPKCKAKKLSELKRERDPLTAIMNHCSTLDIKFLGFDSDYKNRNSRLNLKCNCGNVWNTSYLSFIDHGSGCPSCVKYGYSTNKSEVFYVVHWKNGEREFLKYGITNRGKSRIVHQHSRTEYAPTILYLSSFADGNVAANLEKACHKRRDELYGHNYIVSKDEFSDGFTETMNVDQWSWIDDLVFENTMCRLKKI